MKLENAADVKLAARALRSGWLKNAADKRQAAINCLFDIVENSDNDKLRVMAFMALVRADEADIKRDIVEAKKRAMNEERKLRILELIRTLPPAEIENLAEQHKRSINAG